MFNNRIIIISFFLFNILIGFGQTPFANRVHAKANSLSSSSKVIAKYTDTKRHCVYYIRHNRLFVFDVIKNRDKEVDFSNEGYVQILSSFLSQDGKFVCIITDKGRMTSSYYKDGQELWCINSHTKKSKKIGGGFNIRKLRNNILIKKIFRCKNPQAPFELQHWTAKNYIYDLNCKILYCQPEYNIKIHK